METPSPQNQQYPSKPFSDQNIGCIGRVQIPPRSILLLFNLILHEWQYPNSLAFRQG